VREIVMFQVVSIDTPTLGDRSYLAHDGQVAFVIDPQRDIDRVLALADRLGVEIQHVFETHIHNDYVTGGLALAKAVGATYHVNAADPVRFERASITDRDVVRISSSLSVRAMATPGHTFIHLARIHLAYVAIVDSKPVAAFTGGSLLYGSTGRPDLLGPEATGALVHAQYRSARCLAQELPEEVEVLPTHGFGSFCSATQVKCSASTIGEERQTNPALTRDEDDFVRELLAGLDAYPAYYAHMGPANLAAPSGEPDLSLPRLADASELRRRIERGEWVVDLRHRAAFAAGHLAGSLNFGLDGSFATSLGWLIPWGTPLTLVGETPDQILEARRELVRIGIECLAAATTVGSAEWAGIRPLGTLRLATFQDLATAVRRATASRSTCNAGLSEPTLGPSSMPCTSPCMSCPPVWARSRRVRCGCTADPVIAPRSCWRRGAKPSPSMMTSLVPTTWGYGSLAPAGQPEEAVLLLAPSPCAPRRSVLGCPRRRRLCPHRPPACRCPALVTPRRGHGVVAAGWRRRPDGDGSPLACPPSTGGIGDRVRPPGHGRFLRWYPPVHERRPRPAPCRLRRFDGGHGCCALTVLAGR
jgi:hydroxyacylglutathione hydrolase